MRLGLYPKLNRMLHVLAFPAYTHHFFHPDVGREYGVGLAEKWRLLRRMQRACRSIPSATHWLEHLILVSGLLRIPRSVEGDVIECGCFKGSSTASLSLACELTGRRLIVCDSFAGLPEIQDHDRIHVTEVHRWYEEYRKGDYTGELEEVKANVRRFGAIDRCEFVPGYFERTLPGLSGRFVMAFLDVDLHESLKTCLLHIWPRLADHGRLYTHEATQLAYASRFFDRAWWQQNLGQDAPGLIGAGSGLPAGIGGGSGIGLALKHPAGFNAEHDQQYTRFCGDPEQQEAHAPA